MLKVHKNAFAFDAIKSQALPTKGWLTFTLMAAPQLAWCWPWVKNCSLYEFDRKRTTFMVRPQTETLKTNTNGSFIEMKSQCYDQHSITSPHTCSLVIHQHSITSPHTCSLVIQQHSIIPLPTHTHTLVLWLSTDTVLHPNTCPQIIHWHSNIPQHLSSDYPLTQYYTPTLVLWLSTDTVLYPNTCDLIIHWHSIIPQHMCSDYPLTQYYTSTHVLWLLTDIASVLRLPTNTALYPNMCALIIHWHSIISNMCALIIHWHSIIPNMCALIIHWHSIISQHVCSDYPMTQYYTPT